ncbi:MAG: glutathione S-transferase family protein [Alphaproteobacteria bacterium]|nr:glutathione S-transferase family protein [Alphaproteobacteria bacterium]
MGMMVDGAWVHEKDRPRSADGTFQRTESVFHDRVTADGSSAYPAATGRYHLYVSLACPWAHRTLIFRALKGLEDEIGVSTVEARMGEDGWSFSPVPGANADDLYGVRLLREIYAKADAKYTGRVTVPVLWDKETETIVNNESAEIIRMLNSAFDAWGDPAIDFYPEGLREEIDRINDRVFNDINNGVYKAGFAGTQAAYDRAVDALFATLDDLEQLLGERRYLAGDRITEADWRLFTTLVRFDPVYHGHFKCNLRRIADYPNLSNYLRELYQVPGIAETVDMDHIKAHYYGSHRSINPTGIVPAGPEIDLSADHDRNRLRAAA